MAAAATAESTPPERAFIAVPFNAEKFEGIQINATDRAGNPGVATFGMILRKTPMKIDRINISESFLQAKLPEFSRRYPELTGSEIEKYMYFSWYKGTLHTRTCPSLS